MKKLLILLLPFLTFAATAGTLDLDSYNQLTKAAASKSPSTMLIGTWYKPDTYTDINNESLEGMTTGGTMTFKGNGGGNMSINMVFILTTGQRMKLEMNVPYYWTKSGSVLKLNYSKGMTTFTTDFTGDWDAEQKAAGNVFLEGAKDNMRQSIEDYDTDQIIRIDNYVLATQNTDGVVDYLYSETGLKLR